MASGYFCFDKNFIPIMTFLSLLIVLNIGLGQHLLSSCNLKHTNCLNRQVPNSSFSFSINFIGHSALDNSYVCFHVLSSIIRKRNFQVSKKLCAISMESTLFFFTLILEFL